MKKFDIKNNKFFIIFAVIVLFIWTHSLIPTQESANESAGIKQILQAILDFLHIPLTLTDHFVRKLAHFTEFAAAGTVLGLHFFPRAKIQDDSRLKAVYYSLPFILSLLTAFIDETLQIFSGRGPMVQDIWLDLAGSLFGAGIIRLILLIIDNKKRKKETGQ